MKIILCRQVVPASVIKRYPVGSSETPQFTRMDLPLICMPIIGIKHCNPPPTVLIYFPLETRVPQTMLACVSDMLKAKAFH